MAMIAMTTSSSMSVKPASAEPAVRSGGLRAFALLERFHFLPPSERRGTGPASLPLLGGANKGRARIGED